MNQRTLTKTISPDQLIGRLARPSEFGWIDVRSESEFNKAHIPYFENVPILNNEERHRVGLCYKQSGQEAAIALGHELVGPYRDARIAAWQGIAKGRPTFISCWRGGLRSEIAASWCRQSGIDAIQVDGGYKAIRGVLLKQLNRLPELTLISGLTGVGKTQLLQMTDIASIDLEALAVHRGSAFGGYRGQPQPQQANFENGLLLQLIQAGPAILLEDESRHIGTVSLPNPLWEKMRAAPMIVLESSMSARCRRIYLEYVADPLQRGVCSTDLLSWLSERLARIQKAMGGERYKRILTFLQMAFRGPGGADAHATWIEPLLAEYYDPRYRYGMERRKHQIVFRGDIQQCLEWIQARRN